MWVQNTLEHLAWTLFPSKFGMGIPYFLVIWHGDTLHKQGVVHQCSRDPCIYGVSDSHVNQPSDRDS